MTQHDQPRRSGADVGSENLNKVKEAAGRLLSSGPAERVAGQVNKQWFSREAGIDPQCLKRSRNPKCAEAFDKYDVEDKQRWLSQMQVREIEAEKKKISKTADEQKDELIILLRAEIASLRVELQSCRALRDLVAETGRMP